MRVLHRLIIAGAMVALPSAANAQLNKASGDAAELAAVRAATEKYKDINVAIAEGFISPDGLCDVASDMGFPAEWGAMGVHYFKPDLLGVTAVSPRVDGTGTYTDFSKPAILIYEPKADGSMELIAVENLVFIKAWEAAGHKDPPSFAGAVWDKMVDDPATEVDEAHMFEPHYDRHVWLYRENPNGVFAQFNPKVDCSHGKRAEGHKH